jgi:AcrR family transcriptional regulator
MSRPPGRPRGFDKQEALDTALRLFWRQGYEGTSIAELSQAIGVSVPSLYLAFGNKESLFMQAVEHYGLYSGGMYEAALAQRSAHDVVRRILEGEVDLVTGGDTPDGCLMIQGALATGAGADTIRETLATLRLKAESAVAEKLQALGDLPAGWSARDLASYVMTLAAGIAVQAKSGVSREQLLRVTDSALRVMPKGSRSRDGASKERASLGGSPAKARGVTRKHTDSR